MKRETNIKNNEGITLVALVITIIIIIILATVAINFAFGENGLIREAELARDLTANSLVAEEEGMNSVVAEYANLIKEDAEISIPFEPQETPEPEGGGTVMNDMTNGVIEIKWLSGDSYNVTETPNAPAIKTIDNGSMELVRYTGTGTTEQERWVAGEEYSYVEGTGSNDNTLSKWANARVTINGIDSYFVWIPRYAYRIIYFDSPESKQAYQEGILTEEEAVSGKQIIGYSDSRGIVDAQGKKIDSVVSTTHTMVSEDYFMVHPAFTDEEDNGGWDSQLAGIWIGKYEASLAYKTDGSNIVTDSSTDGDILLSDHTDKTIVTKSGYSSWRYITTGKTYTNAKAYVPNLESHLLKNSEWGAVAYLTESKYGRNGHEVDFSDEGYITGGGTGNEYATRNYLQSSTGNVYGIYDLRGGAWERVAGYYNGSDANKTYLNNGLSFASINGQSDKYATAYVGTDVNTVYKYGDATYETSGWHSDNEYFVNSIGLFFVRGGGYNGSSLTSGVFYYYSNEGAAGDDYSFRLALVV